MGRHIKEKTLTLFVKKDDFEIPSQTMAKEKTADDILKMVRDRISAWAYASDFGKLDRANYKTVTVNNKATRPANLLITRKRKGSTELQRFLAVKIANRELTYMPWDDRGDRRAQVEACLQGLEDEKENLFGLYQKVCLQLPNTGDVSLQSSLTGSV
jgi:hypothetical protein